MLAKYFENICFLREFLRFANLSSDNLYLSISLDKSKTLSIDLKFSLLQPLFIKYL